MHVVGWGHVMHVEVKSLLIQHGRVLVLRHSLCVKAVISEMYYCNS